MFCLLAALAFQAALKPVWAITDLRDLKSPGSSYGRVAADALAIELAKSGGFEIVEGDPVDRSATSLDLPRPLEHLVNLMRVGQDLRASTIVSGEIVDYRVDPGGPARAAIRLVAYDVSSGLPVNGALTVGVADLRPGGTKESALREAIGRAAFTAVATMRSHRGPTARVLYYTARFVAINQGSRAGFRVGMDAIVSLNGRQVCNARVTRVEDDRAEITPEHLSGGMAPGDLVRGAFVPPVLPPAGTLLIDRP